MLILILILVLILISIFVFILIVIVRAIIVTTNIKLVDKNSSINVVDYNSLVLMTSNKNDNVSILLLNMLINQGLKTINIAGLDGYKIEGRNYNYEKTDQVIDKKVLFMNNEKIESSLKDIQKHVSLNFITDSIFKK